VHLVTQFGRIWGKIYPNTISQNQPDMDAQADCPYALAPSRELELPPEKFLEDALESQDPVFSQRPTPKDGVSISQEKNKALLRKWINACNLRFTDKKGPTETNNEILEVLILQVLQRKKSKARQDIIAQSSPAETKNAQEKLDTINSKITNLEDKGTATRVAWDWSEDYGWTWKPCSKSSSVGKQQRGETPSRDKINWGVDKDRPDAGSDDSICIVS